jgi:hypothetical protein
MGAQSKTSVNFPKGNPAPAIGPGTVTGVTSSFRVPWWAPVCQAW